MTTTATRRTNIKTNLTPEKAAVFSPIKGQQTREQFIASLAERVAAGTISAEGAKALVDLYDSAH